MAPLVSKLSTQSKKSHYIPWTQTSQGEWNFETKILLSSRCFIIFNTGEMYYISFEDYHTCLKRCKIAQNNGWRTVAPWNLTSSWSDCSIIFDGNLCENIGTTSQTLPLFYQNIPINWLFVNQFSICNTYYLIYQTNCTSFVFVLLYPPLYLPNIFKLIN